MQRSHNRECWQWRGRVASGRVGRALSQKRISAAASVDGITISAGRVGAVEAGARCIAVLAAVAVIVRRALCLLANVLIALLCVHASIVDDVLEGVKVPSTFAVLPSIGATVHQLLLRDRCQWISCDGVCTFHRTSG